MGNNDYVTYQQAKALKEAGFNEPCDHYYSCDDESKIKHLLVSASPSIWNWNDGCECEFVHPDCSAPTLWQAQKWLREVKGLAINVTAHDGDFYSWSMTYLSICPDDIAPYAPGRTLHTTYEDALSAGITAALGLINPEKKQ